MNALGRLRSLRSQVILAISITLALGLGVLLVIAGSQIWSATQKAYIDEKQAAALALETNLFGLLEHGPLNSTGLDTIQQQITWSASHLNMDVTVISVYQGLVATTHNPAPTANNQPELVAALKGSIGGDRRDGRIYIAVPVIHDPDRLLGVVWVDAPLAPVQTELLARLLTLLVAGLMALGVAILVGWWLSGQIIRPLREVEAAALEMAEGQLDRRVTVSDSVTELGILGRSFNHMAQRIQASIERQREFVANASHELRSPLAAVKVRAEALASNAVEGELAQQYADEISDEMTRLAQLVSDLLTLSKTDGHLLTRPSEAINVADELAAYVRMMRPRASAKHQKLDVHLDSDIPDLYIAPNDLRITAGNLLDNAIKYTPEGGHVELNARWAAAKLIIEVCDTGEGIPPQDLARVTERFFRVDRAHTKNTPGTGLGLALVVAVAQQYGGSLKIESAGIPGKGTRAELTLVPTASAVQE